jgi:hypothetical protein
MNAKVSKMLRKTGHSTHNMKRFWNGLCERERTEIRRLYDETMAAEAVKKACA